MNRLLAIISAGTLLLLSGCQTSAAPATPSTVAVTPTGSDATAEVSEIPFRPPFSTVGWKTDFSKSSIPLEEIMSGGPPKDGIPPIDRPKFISQQEDTTWLKEVEPVIALVVNNEAKAYPLQIMTWHEIVNDTIGGVPVSVTFCPLCNTAIAFDQRLDGKVYDFGTTGRLRYSDLIMYDRQTESWWQQITGEAIVGELTGKILRPLPAAIISWRDFQSAYPAGMVLSRDTGDVRAYGQNPYSGYDNINSAPFLFQGKYDGRLAPMERVVTISQGNQDFAVPFPLLAERKVVHLDAGGVPMVVFWAPGTVSALDKNRIAESRDIGATGAFQAQLDGQPLTFTAAGDGVFTDGRGSSWNLAGQAITGPAKGKELTPVVHANHFWFAWAAFKPDTTVYQP